MASEKQMITQFERNRDVRNPYYMRISGMYQLLKWGTLLLFTLFLVLMLVLERDSITYENLMYLVRDLRISTESGAGFVSVSYEEQQNMRFGVYRGELVVAGSSGIRLYGADGTPVLQDSISYRSPVLETGDKYMLLYDAGGTEYAIFTALACVERMTTSEPIQYISLSDSGAHCVVTRSDEARYVITLYNSAFMRVARYYRDSYVTAAAVHPDGKSLAVLSVSTVDWSLTSEVTFFSASSDKTIGVSLGSSLPLSVRYLKNGNLVVVCDDCVVYLSESGEELSRVSLSPMTLSCFSVSDNKTALVCCEDVLGSRTRILVLDSVGGVLCDTAGNGKILGITASSGQSGAYILYSDSIEILSVLGSETVSYAGPLQAVREIAGTAVLCFSDGAEQIDGAISRKPGGNE